MTESIWFNFDSIAALATALIAVARSGFGWWRRRRFQGVSSELGGTAQGEVADPGAVEELSGRGGRDRPISLHDDPVVADLQRLLGVLLDRELRHADIPQGLEEVDQLLDRDQ